MIRKALHIAALALLALPLVAGAVAAQEVRLYKTPWCGCCTAWGRYLAAAGFTVRAEDLEDLTLVKTMAGVPARLQACHTAVIAGYVVEGHVPLAAIRELLDERPEVRGIAVPGMPAGSPGMGGPPETYTVFAFTAEGEIRPLAAFRGERRL